MDQCVNSEILIHFRSSSIRLIAIEPLGWAAAIHHFDILGAKYKSLMMVGVTLLTYCVGTNVNLLHPDFQTQH